MFDSDFNPQNDLQAQARSHRIGQKKEVKVYRLITRKSYESQLFVRACQKLALDQVLLGGLKDDKGLNMNAEEVEKLLRLGCYELMGEDEDADVVASKSYEDQDIDTILSSHAREIDLDQLQGVPKDRPFDRKTTFAKASFVPKDSAREIDVDDPNFWVKLLPDGATAAERLLAQLATSQQQPIEHDLPSSSSTSSSSFRKRLTTVEDRALFFRKVAKITSAMVESRKDGDTPDDMPETLRLLRSTLSSPLFNEENALRRVQTDTKLLSSTVFLHPKLENRNPNSNSEP